MKIIPTSTPIIKNPYRTEFAPFSANFVASLRSDTIFLKSNNSFEFASL